MTDCVLTFTGTQQGKWYAITIQVSDMFFLNIRNILFRLKILLIQQVRQQ
jgi:hypothetical protein